MSIEQFKVGALRARLAPAEAERSFFVAYYWVRSEGGVAVYEARGSSVWIELEAEDWRGRALAAEAEAQLLREELEMWAKA